MRRAVLLCWLVGCDVPFEGKDTAPPDPATSEPTDTETDGFEPIDFDDDGSPASEDCDDGDPDVHPGAVESCNGQDDDCDGAIDEGLDTPGYLDADGDGHGDPDSPVEGCDGDAVVPTGGDCDDTDADVHPGAEEVCNDRDDDCDDEVDEDVISTFYRDEDGDGWGVGDDSVTGCAPPTGYAAGVGDCDDGVATTFPGAPELCNAVDDDCDGTADEDKTCPCAVEYWPDPLHPYLFCEITGSWPDAAALCDSYDYRLVTLDSQAELDWVQLTASAYDPNYWWLGYTDAASEGAWIWEDGSTVSYINWCASEPNNAHGGECVADVEEDCALLNWGSGGCWNDYPCSCTWAFAICEGLSEARPRN